MSAVDQAGPERISLLPDDGWSWCAGSPPMEPDRIEYIRADLVEAADMAECAAFFAGYDAGEASRADLAAPSAPAEVDGLVITDEMVEDGLAHYSEGGCCGLGNDERREVVRAILEAAIPVALTALQAENEQIKAEWAADLVARGKRHREAISRAEKAEAERDAWKANAEALAGNLDRIHYELPTGQDWHVSKVLYEHEELKGEV